MAQLTIMVPDELAGRLQSMKERLPEILEIGLRHLTSPEAHGYGEVIELLADGPTPQAIVSFQASEKFQRRACELLAKNRENVLTPEEKAELDQYESLDYLMTLVKARARIHISSTPV